MYQRGGVISLLTEALVNSDGTIGAELPVSLRDLLLAAVAVLPERTQQALAGTLLLPARGSVICCSRP